MSDTPQDGKTNDDISKESADLLADQKHVNADTRSAEEIAKDSNVTPREDDTITAEDPKLGSVQDKQDGSVDQELDTPDAEGNPEPELREPNEPVPDQDKQEERNELASHKPGEALGRTTSEQKAAEKDPDSAKETNPVGEATQHESKDPYAEGKHIANPEPNNGKGDDPDAFDREQEEKEVATNEK